VSNSLKFLQILKSHRLIRSSLKNIFRTGIALQTPSILCCFSP